MRTEDLIADLAGRAAPVRPLPSPAFRFLGWAALACGCAIAGIAVFGVRQNLADVATSAGFLAVAAPALATIAFTAIASLVLAVPGAERSAIWRFSSLALVTIWGATVIAAVAGTGRGLTAAADWPVCVIRVMAIAIVPAIVLVMMIRRAAPLRPLWTGALLLAAAMSTGAAAIQIICPVQDPGHALLGHFGPVLMGLALGVAIAPLLRSWKPPVR